MRFTCPHCLCIIEIPETCESAGRKGGKKLAEVRGAEHMRRIGVKGWKNLKPGKHS